MECKICNKKVNGTKGLGVHLTKSHKYTKEQIKKYYNQYLKSSSETGKCIFCGEEAIFKNLTDGYHNICLSKKCLGKTRATGTYEFLMYKYNLTKEDALIEQEKRAKHRGEKIKEKFDELYENDKEYHNKRMPNQPIFWESRGYSKEESIKLAKETHQKGIDKIWEYRRAHPEKYKDCNTTQIAYWMKKGFTEEESEIKVSERQRTFTLDKCIEKLGKEKGHKRWLDRQELWHKNYKKSNFSQISQELFWGIYNKLDSYWKIDIAFATIDENGKLDNSGKNNEERLRLDSIVLPDFIDLKTNKVIEFNGSYYHSMSKERIEADNNRTEMLERYGYKLLHIDELNYKQNKEKVIQECIDFLTK